MPATHPNYKDLLGLHFAVPERQLARITHAEAETAHKDLVLMRDRGENPDGRAVVAVLTAARNALESQVIFQG